MSSSLSPGGEALFFSTSRSDPRLGPLPGRWTRAELLRRHGLPGAGGMDIWWVSAAVLDEYH